MKLSKLLLFTVQIGLLIALISSCDTTSTNTEPGQGSVELQFKTVSGSSSSKSVSSGKVSSSDDSLTIEGTNGTLLINDILFIVEKFKLEPADTDNDSTEIEEFESEPFFVDLPLSDSSLSLANSRIQAGLYEELEFEVKDLDFEDEEESEDQEHQELADSIRSEFPDWPDEASMVLIGTFIPSDGDPKSFKVFAKAEIEIELEFNPPLEVTGDNIQQVVSVQINPSRWVQQEDDNVLDLSRYDWNEHQQLLEFEAKFKDGVEDIEVDDDEDREDEEEEEDDD